MAEYTTELLNVLHVLGRLVALEPKQESLLERICAGATIPAESLKAAMDEAPAVPPRWKVGRARNEKQGELLG